MLHSAGGWRSVPLIRPHSWHLEQISDSALPPPPPPPSPPCLPPADSPPLPPPPPPSAMQLHPGAYSLHWHTNDNSDLSMQWGQLSRPYSSTERSSSLGSMESLDTPTPTAQTYSDSHNSPVDPALFNNKRDSAYSSFSASSNTSDYATVPLRFGEGGSMENLLQNIGPNCDASSQGLDNGQLITLKSRSLTRPRPKPVVMKERPSSCCYEDVAKDFVILQNGEEEPHRKSNPPLPPKRKDSFRATKGCPNVENNRCASAPIEIARAKSYYGDHLTPLNSESVLNGFLASEDDNETKHFKEDTLDSYYIQNQASLTQTETSIYRPQTKHSSANVLHRHSAPEKLLATQLQLLEFDSDNAPMDPYIPPKSTNVSSSSSQWSQPEKDRDVLHNHFQPSSNKWSGSRCSTPGSVFLEDGGENGDFNGRLVVNGETKSPAPSLISWGRSVSVPEETLALSVHSKHNTDQMHERDFEPLSSAASVDTLVEKEVVKIDDNLEIDTTMVKKSSRNLRKNRRRNERFATNLRNEIQRKKAQLQSSRGPGGLLCSGETVHEEGPDFYEDGESEVPESKTKVAFTTTSPQDLRTIAKSDSNCEVLPRQSNTSRSVQIVDPGLPDFGVGIRVVEEPAPAGKARRWRWTPENKLQPENEPPKKLNNEKVLGVASSRHGVCAFTSSSTSTYPRSMSCSRMDESDLLPFADRMKFFEETSKGITIPKAATQPRQKTYHSEHQAGNLGPYQSQRRYSYQGGCRPDIACTLEARRPSVSSKERDERLRQLELERLEELELEKARRKEMEKEQWEREREQQELERNKEMDRLKREKEALERERRREEYYASNNQELHQLYHHHQIGFHSYQPNVHGFDQSHSQVSRSAFYPVHSQPQHFENQQHQEYAARSHTPTEMYPARQQDAPKLNRKYSLTERDYTSKRWDSRPLERPQSHQSHWGQRQNDTSSNGYSFAPPPAPLRARAMSENDLRFDTAHRWSPSLSFASSQTLSEVEEGLSNNTRNETAKKKMPPPPRPPPPKWEQFHRRRASHHAIYASSVPQSGAGDFSSQSSLLPEPEMSRQRSYSLPPQRRDLTPACPKCTCHQSPPQDQPTRQTSPKNPAFEIHHNPQPQLIQEPLFNIAPPSPMFSRRAFRPVAPPQRSSRGSVSEEDFPPPPPPVTDDIENSLSDTETIHNPDQVSIVKTQLSRHTAEWERTPSPTIHSDPAPPPPPPPPPPPIVQNGTPESFHFIDTLHLTSDIDMLSVQVINTELGTESETTLSPAQSLELDVPLETDIDDFHDEELPVSNEPISSELPCFALPVTVLETDLDTLPDQESSPSGKTRPESSLLDEELEVREGLSLEEIFPQSSEGESYTESWRGASRNTEHNMDSLDRRSGASSSCSSYYSTSTAKAQLLAQMKDLTENREREENDELTYKKQLMESLRKKLGVLREAQRGLQEDIRANAQLGEEVESMVVSVCKPNEVDKFRMFIGDLDKVVSLMLSLSGRLLRVETTLDTLDSEADHDERLPLLEKKRQLMRQLSEAQDLKEHVDRREQAVSRVLGRCLTPEQHRDYSHFVKMKAALLVEQRQLEDKIRLGEEQLRGLRESLGLGLGLGIGLSMGYGQY